MSCLTHEVAALMRSRLSPGFEEDVGPVMLGLQTGVVLARMNPEAAGHLAAEFEANGPPMSTLDQRVDQILRPIREEMAGHA